MSSSTPRACGGENETQKKAKRLFGDDQPRLMKKTKKTNNKTAKSKKRPNKGLVE
jgi:hypothetical protein